MIKKRRPVHRTLKKYLIPHRGNSYRPHLLHPKHTLWYSALFLALKGLLIVIAFLIPAEAFVSPDVLAQQQTKLIALTNNLRAEKGLPTLTIDPRLTQSATARANDMETQQYFSHVSPDGHRLNYFLNNAGYPYRTAGENLAMGFSDAESAMNGWLKSQTHYANLVDPDFQQMGIGLEGGVYHDKPTVFVAQHFGTPFASSEGEPAPVPEAPRTHPEPSPTPSDAEGQVARAPATTRTTVTFASRVTTPTTTETVATTTPPRVTAPVIPVGDTPSIPRPRPPVAIAPRTSSTRTLPVSREEISVPLPTTVPLTTIATAPIASSTPAAVIAPPAASSTVVLAANYRYDPDQSFVDWDEKNGRTSLQVQARLEGDILYANTIIDGYPIELTKTADGEMYVGSLTIATPAKELFKTVVSPALTILTSDRVIHAATIEWRDPQVVSETPWQRYLQANSWLYTSIPVFAIVHWFYILALILFVTALTLAVCIELRKQHPHVLLRAVALVVLLVWCVKF